MVSHHVTSSRLLVHFAMEQHLLAATPGFLRKFHFFALVNKTFFFIQKILFREATGDLAKLEFVPAQKCAKNHVE